MTKMMAFLRHSKPTVWTYTVSVTGLVAVLVSYIDRLAR